MHTLDHLVTNKRMSGSGARFSTEQRDSASRVMDAFSLSGVVVGTLVVCALFTGLLMFVSPAVADDPNRTIGNQGVDPDPLFANEVEANATTASSIGDSETLVLDASYGDADIVMSVGEYPDEVTPTETFTVPVTVENRGSGTSEEIRLGYDTIDGLSVEDWAGSVGPLDPGEEASDEWVFRLDSDDGGSVELVAIGEEVTYAPEPVEVEAAEEEPDDPFFLVDVVNPNPIVDEGEAFDITVEVENTGGESDTQTIEIDTDGLGTATEEVSLRAGESTTVTETFSTSSGDAGEYRGDVESEDDSTNIFVGVEEDDSEPADLVMSVGEYPDEVTPTETFTVPVTVENQGGEASEEIDLGIDTTDGLSVEEWPDSIGPLDSGEQEEAEWEFRLDSDDGGHADTVAVGEEPPYPSERVEVEAAEEEPEEPFFLVDIVDSSVIVDEGDDVDIAVDIENTGGESDTQTIEIDTDGLGTATEEVSLRAGESTTVTETFSTSRSDAGEYLVTVESNDDSTTGFVGVEEVADPAFLEVADFFSSAETVEQGDSIDVAATVINTGDEEGTQEVAYRIGGNVVHTTTVTLDGGADTVVEFTDIETSDLEGEYEHGVFTRDDSQTATLSVTAIEPAFFEVADLDPSHVRVEQGELVDFTATVRNTGDEAAAQRIELRISDETVAERYLTLDGSEDTTVEFRGIDTSQYEAGDYDYRIVSADAHARGELTIEAPQPNFEITNANPSDVDVDHGERLSVSATIHNDGDGEATQTIDLRVNATSVDTQTVTLAPTETQTVRFDTVDSSNFEPGIQQYEVVTDNDTTSGAFTIHPPAPPTIEEIIRPNAYESQEEYTFSVSYAAADEVTVSMSVNGEQVHRAEPIATSGSVEFTYSFTPGIHTIDFEVRDQHGQATTDGFTIDVDGQGPTIDSHSPTDTRVGVTTGETVEFSVGASHPDAQAMDIEWYADESLIDQGTWTVEESFRETGLTEIEAAVTDEEGQTSTRTWRVQADTFQASPRYTDHTTATTLNPDGTTEIVTVSISHPEVNDRTAIAEIRAEIPDGVGVAGVQGVDEADAAQATVDSEVRPGTQEQLALELQLLEDSELDEYKHISYEILYYPADTPEDTVTIREDDSLELYTGEESPETAGEHSNDADGDDEADQSEESTADSSVDEFFAPGFNAVGTFIALVLITVVARRASIPR